MDERKLMESISKKLQPAAATVIALSVVEKGSDKMYARLGGSLKHSAPENPWFGRVKIETKYVGLMLGSDYKSHVAGAAVRSGAASAKKDVDVNSSDRCWHIAENRFFETDKKTHTKFYLKIQCATDTMQNAPMVSMVETYIIDGKRYTRKEAEKVLDGYLKPIKPKAPTSTQIAAGVDEERAVRYYLPKLVEIVSIEQGDYTYTR